MKSIKRIVVLLCVIGLSGCAAISKSGKGCGGADWKRIGTMMQGFGAGYNGRGAQFSENLRAKRQVEERRNQEAQIDYILDAKAFIDRNDIPGLVKYLRGRLHSNTNYRTCEELDSAIAGLKNPELIVTGINEMYKRFVAKGLIRHVPSNP
mgnify:CR=1 FL=1